MGISDREAQMRLMMMLLALVCSGVTTASEDRFETINRKVHGFNDFVDTKLIRPAAKAYKKVLPIPVRYSVRNFFGNLSDVGDIINNALQGKPKQALSDLGISLAAWVITGWIRCFITILWHTAIAWRRSGCWVSAPSC